MVPESDREDVPIDDKCLSVRCTAGNHSVYVINQAAGKVFRRSLIDELKTIEGLPKFDIEEFIQFTE